MIQAIIGICLWVWASYLTGFVYGTAWGCAFFGVFVVLCAFETGKALRK